MNWLICMYALSQRATIQISMIYKHLLGYNDNSCYCIMFTIKGIYFWLWILVVLLVQVWGLNPTIKSYKLLYTLRQDKPNPTTSRFRFYNIKSQEALITKYRLWIWIKVLYLFDVHNLLIWMHVHQCSCIPAMKYTWLSYMYPHWFLILGYFELIIHH